MLRYLMYPLQAGACKEGINHILEPGYAHAIQAKFSGDRTVVTVHDLIPLLAWRGEIPGLSYPHRPRLVEYSLRHLSQARCLVAVSESTRRDLVRLLGCRSEAIHVCPLGFDETFRPMTPGERLAARNALGLGGRGTKWVLITGHQSYKNHRTAVKVLRSLIDVHGLDVRLLRLGRVTGEWSTLVAEYKLADRALNFDYLPLADVVKLYNAADVLFFPSWYEGFGLPPLQAMACGLPVVCSNAGSLPEVVGPAGFRRNPDDEEGLCHDLYNLLTDVHIREQMVGHGIDRAQNFTWKSHVAKLIEIYRSIN
jgi:glycosyltransferase involved in cell wall biosynthesis